jgi:hypothetical protein
MKKWQRNVIYRAVEAGGLDPRECTFDYGDTGARITHVPSASYLLLEGDITAYTAKAVVVDSEQWPFGLRTFWVEVEERVRGWAQQVKEDVDTPDLWAGLQREREILTGARYEDVENTPFTSDEQAAIAEHLRQTKEYVTRKYSLSDAQVLHLEAKLDDIAAAAGRVGRKDWTLFGLRCSARCVRPGDPAPRSCAGHPQDDARRPRLPLRRRGWTAGAPTRDVRAERAHRGAASFVGVSRSGP